MMSPCEIYCHARPPYSPVSAGDSVRIAVQCSAQAPAGQLTAQSTGPGDRGRTAIQRWAPPLHFAEALKLDYFEMAGACFGPGLGGCRNFLDSKDAQKWIYCPSIGPQPVIGQGI